MITLTLPIHLLTKNFVHTYCRTCHDFQGSSIDETIPQVRVRKPEVDLHSYHQGYGPQAGLLNNNEDNERLPRRIPLEAATNR